MSKCLLAESAPKERSRFAHGSDSKLVQNGPHGPKALTVRSRFDIQNWSKMVLMGQKRSRFAHGNVQNDYRRTFALKMVVSRKIMVSRKRSLTLRSRSAHANFTKWDPFFAKWWFRGKSRSRSLTVRSRNGVRFSQNGPNGRFGEKPRSRFAHGMAF